MAFKMNYKKSSFPFKSEGGSALKDNGDVKFWGDKISEDVHERIRSADNLIDNLKLMKERLVRSTLTGRTLTKDPEDEDESDQENIIDDFTNMM